MASSPSIPLVDVKQTTSYSQLDEERGRSTPNTPTTAAVKLTTPTSESRRRWILAGGLFAAITIAVMIPILVIKLRSSHSVSTPTSTVQGRDQKTSPEDAASTARYRVASDPTYTHFLYMPPRLQWNENYGYCGSTSMICCGMYFGEYISQYDNRNIASNGTNQEEESSQLLLGVNDYWAAHQHKMTNELWDYSDTNVENFFVWIKTHILQNHPVIIGIFENDSVFGNKPPDPDYDHIVPVYGWGSNHDLSDLSYYADDVIYFSDNGLYTPDGTTSIYNISAAIGVFAQSRKDADKASAAVYSVNGDPTQDDPNYGIAITGLVDIHNDCLPTMLTSDKNYESPEIVDGSNTRPTPMAMTLTATVSGLTVGTTYNLYQYNDMANCPSSNFNANAGNALNTYTFTATSDTYQQSVQIESNELAIFRCVAASAP